MTWSPDSSIAGGAQTGFATPVFPNVATSSQDSNGHSKAVTSITGMSGARAHSVSDPFVWTFSPPKNPRVLPQQNPVTGLYGNVPNNVYNLHIRKGVLIAANQAPRIASARLEISVPAGADAYDAVNVRALVSLLVGLLSEQSTDLGDTVVSGIVS